MSMVLVVSPAAMLVLAWAMAERSVPGPVPSDESGDVDDRRHHAVLQHLKAGPRVNRSSLDGAATTVSAFTLKPPTQKVEHGRASSLRFRDSDGGCAHTHSVGTHASGATPLPLLCSRHHQERGLALDWAFCTSYAGCDTCPELNVCQVNSASYFPFFYHLRSSFALSKFWRAGSVSLPVGALNRELTPPAGPSKRRISTEQNHG